MRFLVALFGAVAFEVVHWYHLREKLSQTKVRTMLRSPSYWTITILMAVISAVGAVLLGENLTRGQLVVAGAAFPSLFTKAVAAFKPAQVQLGAETEAARVSDYFI